MPKQLDMVKCFQEWQGEKAWALADAGRAMLHSRGMIMKLSRVKLSKAPTPPRTFRHLQGLADILTVKAHETHDPHNVDDATLNTHDADDADNAEECSMVPIA